MAEPSANDGLQDDQGMEDDSAKLGNKVLFASWITGKVAFGQISPIPLRWPADS